MEKFGQTLQSLPRQVLYLILFICASVPLFFKIPVPNQPEPSSIDYYAHLMQLPQAAKVLICSDWTNGTRGESMGEFDATVKILMRRGIKFAVYSIGDPQAPQVARDEIAKISLEEGGGKPLYKPYLDYVVMGYFPNAEGQTAAINTDVIKAFSSKTDTSPTGPKPVEQSPVWQGIKSLSNFSYLLLITPSNTDRIVVERITKTPLMYAVTGVMVPEEQVYYAAGQLKGLVGGIKGVFDMETLMETGINEPGPHEVTDSRYGQIPGFPGKENAGKGTAYYPALHLCLTLLILAVIVGNVGMLMTRKAR